MKITQGYGPVVLTQFGMDVPPKGVSITIDATPSTLDNQDMFSLDPLDPGDGQRLNAHFPWNTVIGPLVVFHFGAPFSEVVASFDSAWLNVPARWQFVADVDRQLMEIRRDGLLVSNPPNPAMLPLQPFIPAAADLRIGGRITTTFAGDIGAWSISSISRVSPWLVGVGLAGGIGLLAAVIRRKR